MDCYPTDYIEAVRKEYSQWKFCQSLLDTLTQKTRGFTKAEHIWKDLKLLNNFGRWLMTLQFTERHQLDDRFPLFAWQPLKDSSSKLEFVKSLQESFVDMSLGQARTLVDEQLIMIDQFLRQNGLDLAADTDNPEVHFQNSAYGGRIIVGDFQTPCCPRVNFLVYKFGLPSTALACMRYDHLKSFRGGEAGLSVTAFNALQDIGAATHEGFASPINCRLLGRPDAKFCSLFADTDSAFGSLGNFFLINLREHPGGWVLNPPFIEPVMEATVRRVVNLLQEAESGTFWFYITFPMWEDCQAWHSLDQSEWKVARIDIAKTDEYLIQDCYGKILYLHVPLCIFVLGAPPAEVDLTELHRRVSIYHRDTVKRDSIEACSVDL